MTTATAIQAWQIFCSGLPTSFSYFQVNFQISFPQNDFSGLAVPCFETGCCGSHNVNSILWGGQTSAEGKPFSESLLCSHDLDLIKQITVASPEVFIQPVRQKLGT